MDKGFSSALLFASPLPISRWERDWVEEVGNVLSSQQSKFFPVTAYPPSLPNDGGDVFFEHFSADSPNPHQANGPLPVNDK